MKPKKHCVLDVHQSPLDSLEALRQVKEFQRAEIIFSQGDTARSFLYIQKGGVKLSAFSEVGSETVVAVLGPGDFLGEGCLAGQSVRMATATAIAPTTAMVIEPEVLDNLDRAARGLFLQGLFKTVAKLDLSDTVSLDYWEQILRRRGDLAEGFGKPISLRIMIVEVLAFSSQLHLPILMEYEEWNKLQISAATDPLTGLYNRRSFEDHFERELDRAQRYNQHLALVMLDLHQFKEVNDRYGHQQGDILLRTVAVTLQKSLRTSDYAFRIGGDEFSLLLIQSDIGQSTALTRRVCAKVAAAVESMQIPLTLGPDFGVAVYPEDGNRRKTLIRVADERLYETKHPQRNATALLYPALAMEPEAPDITLFTPEGPLPPTAPSEATRYGDGAEQRKCERVSMAGTSAYAQLVGSLQTTRVLDFSYGGVALEVNAQEELPPMFQAVIRLPIMQPMCVNLRRLYQVPGTSGQKRVGCAFVNQPENTGSSSPRV